MTYRDALAAVLLLTIAQHAYAHPDAPTASTSPPRYSSGFVVPESGGEILRQTASGVEIIKIPPEASAQLGMATTHFKAEGTGIAVHKHLDDDEAFFVHRGTGTFTLGEYKHEIREGDIVFIPKGTWHGFENSGTDTVLVWAISSSKYLELHRMFFSDFEPSPAEGERLYKKYGFADKQSN